MKAKTKIGMGMKTKTRKRTSKKASQKRIFPVAKRGGILPLLPLLGVLRSLAGGAAGIAKAVYDNKAAQHQLQECNVIIAPWKAVDFISCHTSADREISKRKKKNVEKK